MSFENADESYDVGGNISVAYEIDQGDLTIDDDARIGASLRKEPAKTWDTPAEEGNLMKITATNSRVQAAVAGDQEIVGWLAHDPWNGKNTEVIPDRDNGQGPFSDRFLIADVEIMASFQRTVARDQDGGSVVVALGDSVIHSDATANTWEGKASLTNTNFVTRVTATEVTALWGYWGKQDGA